ncbi:MAG: hypothetical protein R3E84_14275 [Pseudomonadales bacterium]
MERAMAETERRRNKQIAQCRARHCAALGHQGHCRRDGRGTCTGAGQREGAHCRHGQRARSQGGR